MINPLVSICIPCYNSANFLNETLECFVNQTYKNIEIVVVDDGSMDKSAEILAEFSDKDHRICFYTQKNKGAGSARNNAFRKSKGSLILFFDADDVIADNFIQSLVNRLDDSPDKITAAQIRRFSGNNIANAKPEPMETWQNLKPMDWLLIDNGKGLGMMQSGMFLIPRNLIEKSSLWLEELNLIDDFEFFPRIFLESSEILFEKDAIVYYRSGINNSLSNILNKKALTSAHLALSLTTEKILSIENSARAKSVMANYWALWAYHFYASAPNLFKDAEAMILKLSGNKYKPELSGFTKISSLLIGWKLTKKLKNLVAKF